MDNGGIKYAIIEIGVLDDLNNFQISIIWHFFGVYQSYANKARKRFEPPTFGFIIESGF